PPHYFSPRAKRETAEPGFGSGLASGLSRPRWRRRGKELPGRAAGEHAVDEREGTRRRWRKAHGATNQFLGFGGNRAGGREQGGKGRRAREEPAGLGVKEDAGVGIGGPPALSPPRPQALHRPAERGGIHVRDESSFPGLE